MIKQKNIIIKTSTGALTYMELGEIVCNSSTDITITLPTPNSGLWYRLSNVGTGIVTVYYNTTLTTLNQTEQCLCLANGTSSWFFSKGGSGSTNTLTKADVESVLTGEITSHTHPSTSGVSYVDIIIPITGWLANTGDYPYKVNITIPNVVATDVLILLIDKESLDNASDVGICSTLESFDGGVTLFSETIPTVEISANCIIVSSLVGSTINTKYYVNSIDKPPLVSSTWDDEFNDTTLNSKWTYVNQGTATVSFIDGNFTTTLPSASSTERLIVQPRPSNNFTVIAKVNAVGERFNYYSAGVALYNGNNGKILNCAKEFYTDSSSFIVHKFTNVTTYLSTTALRSYVGDGWIYVKITIVGSLYEVTYSFDGLIWIYGATEDLSTFIGTDFTHIGLSFHRNNTTVVKPIYGICNWFRVTQP